MRKFKPIILGAFAALMMVSTAFADIVIQNVSTWTPDREGIPYVKDMPGLSYPSFNNLINNTNIAEGDRAGDERRFTIGKHCPAGDCSTGLYYNTLSKVKAGDKVRVSIYFHNNGEDPYDGGTLSSPNAKNVQIGVDLNNIVDSTHDFLAKPRGFIYADNNEYRTNKTDSTTVIKVNGQTLRTATDDMQVVFENSQLYFEPVQDSAQLLMKQKGGTSFSGPVTTGKTLELNTGDNSTVLSVITQKIENNKFFLNFSELPGCFRYSGFAYFDLVVKERPSFCTELSIKTPTALTAAQTKALTGEDNYGTVNAVSLETIKYLNNAAIPEDAELQFSTTDPNGTYILPNFTGLGSKKYFEMGTTTNMPAKFFFETEGFNKIYYKGAGKIMVKVLNGKCEDAYTFPTPAPTVCANMSLNTYDIETFSDTNPKTYTCLKNDIHIFMGEYYEDAAKTKPIDASRIQVKWTSSDPNGVFFDLGNFLLLFFGQEKDLGGTGEYIGPKGIIYQGGGNVSATLYSIDGKLVSNTVCKAEVKRCDTEATCKALKVNKNSVIHPEVITTFNAKSEATDGKDFNGKITYSVDAGYGEFFTTLPSGYLTNPTVKVTEFDESKAVENGGKPFCSSSSNPLFTINPKDLLNPNTKLEVDNNLPTIDDLKGNNNTIDPKNLPNIPPATGTGSGSGSGTGTSTFELDKDVLDSIKNPTTTTVPGVSTGAAQKKDDLIIDPSVFEELPDYLKTGVKPLPTPIPNPAPGPVPPSPFSGTNPFNPKSFQSNSFLAFTPTELEVEIKDLNVVEVQMKPTGVQTITVDPGTKVYFVGKKAGTGVVHVSTQCTDQAGCKRNFDIAQPMICGGTDFLITDLENVKDPNKKTYTCLEKSTHVFVSKFYEDAAKTKQLDPTQTKVRWSTTDPTGAFIPLEELPALIVNPAYATTNGKKSGFIGGASIIYVGGGQVSGTLATYVGLPISSSNTCKVVTQPCTNNCANLTLTSTPAAPLNVGQAAQFTLGGKDLKNQDLPATTKVRWSTDTGALSINPTSDVKANALSGTINQTIYFTGSDKAGNVVVELETTDPLYSPICKASVPVNTTLVCTGLSVNQNKDLEPNSLVTLRSSASYVGPITTPRSTYTTTQGVFLLTNKEPGLALLTTLQALPTKEAMLQLLGPDGATTVTRDDGTDVYLLLFKDASGTAFSVTAQNRTEAACTKSFPVVVEPVSTNLCIDLSITYPTNGNLDQNDEDQLFRIDVATSPNNFKNSLDYKWTVTDGDADFEDTTTDGSDGTDAYENQLENIDSDRVKVRVYATDSNGNTLKNEDGEQICYDTLTLDRDEDDEDDDEPKEPSIEKFVYDKKSNKLRDYLGLNSKDKGLVNFVVEYKAGEFEYTEIQDNSLKNGKINAISGLTTEGSLNFKGMLIAVDKQVIYKEGFTESEISKYDFDFDVDDDASEKKWSCAEKDDELCLEDYDNVSENFQDGDTINIRNLGKNDKVYVIYQLTNNHKINADTCKKLQGQCGEEFRNKVEFVAYEEFVVDDNEADDKDDDEDYPGDTEGEKADGDDNAKVIVFCPYFLARQSGDILIDKDFSFNDIKGIDVSKCSDVKSIDAPIIKEVEVIEKVTSTGSGDSKIQGATGKACKVFENNALDNFSSSICETSSSVAKQWTKENIKDAVAENLAKVSKGKTTFQNATTADLSGKSGVIVVKGDLTIDSKLNADKKATYIVQGDLIVNANVEYKDPLTLTNPNALPSIAFVVEGDIKVGKAVTEMAGIYMSVNGKITGTESDEQLTIFGSLIGNITDLFNSRTNAGDPLKGESAITVIYEERVILNTPPGLSELMDVSQLRVAK